MISVEHSLTSFGSDHFISLLHEEEMAAVKERKFCSSNDHLRGEKMTLEAETDSVLRSHAECSKYRPKLMS